MTESRYYLVYNFGNPTTLRGPDPSLMRVTFPRTERGGAMLHKVLVDAGFWEHQKRTTGMHAMGPFEGEPPPEHYNGTHLSDDQWTPAVVRSCRLLRLLDHMAEAHFDQEIRRLCSQQAHGIRSGLIGPPVIEQFAYRVRGRMERDGSNTEECYRAYDCKPWEAGWWLGRPAGIPTTAVVDHSEAPRAVL